MGFSASRSTKRVIKTELNFSLHRHFKYRNEHFEQLEQRQQKDNQIRWKKE